MSWILTRLSVWVLHDIKEILLNIFLNLFNIFKSLFSNRIGFLAKN